MFSEKEIQERLYRNRALLLEAERERLFRAPHNQDICPNLVLLALAYFGRWLIWLGTRLEAQYDCHKLGIGNTHAK